MIYSFERLQIEQNFVRHHQYRIRDHNPDNEAIEIRPFNMQLNHQQIVYNRSNNTSERNQENGLSVAFKRIMKKWNRGSSIHPIIKNESCSICLSSFSEGESVIQLRCNQKHWFHSSWIIQWAKNKSTWPICRSDFIKAAKQEHLILRQAYDLSIHDISVQ